MLQIDGTVFLIYHDKDRYLDCACRLKTINFWISFLYYSSSMLTNFTQIINTDTFTVGAQVAQVYDQRSRLRISMLSANVTRIGKIFDSIKIFYPIDHFISSSHEAFRRDNHSYEDNQLILQHCQIYQEDDHSQIKEW